MDDTNCYKEISVDIVNHLEYNLVSFKAAKAKPEIKSIDMFTGITFSDTKSRRHTFQIRYVQSLTDEIINDIVVDTVKYCLSADEYTSCYDEFTMVIVFDAEFALKASTREYARKIPIKFNEFAHNLYPKKHIMMYEYSGRGLFPFFP